MTIRMHAGSATKSPITTINGNRYTPVPGTPLDVPDQDAQILEANGWVKAFPVGATAARPATPSRQQYFIDTTITAVIVWDGAAWRNAITGAAV